MNEVSISPKRTEMVVYQFMDTLAQLISDRVCSIIEEQQAKIIDLPITDEEFCPDELLSIKEVMNILKVKRGTIYNWKANKILVPDTYIGRSPRYKRSSVDNFIEKRA